MNDFVQLQNDLTYGLLSEDALARINIVQYRKLRLQGQLDLSTVWLTPRNGFAGCGVLVEMPEFEVAHPNVSGPIGQLVMPLLVVEEPNLNFAPATPGDTSAPQGTGLAAEEVAQLILDGSHQWSIGPSGQLQAAQRAIQVSEEFEGLVAYRVRLTMQMGRQQTARVASVAATAANGHITLTCATVGAAGYWTGDGSFPGPANSTANLYTIAFAASGFLRFAAYKTGMIRSAVTTTTI